MSGSAPAAKVDNTQRKKWDVEEFARKAEERRQKDDAVGEETAKQRRNREKRERDPLHMGLIMQRSHLKARDFEVDLTSRLGKTQMIAAGADISAQVRHLALQHQSKECTNKSIHSNDRRSGRDRREREEIISLISTSTSISLVGRAPNAPTSPSIRPLTCRDTHACCERMRRIKGRILLRHLRVHAEGFADLPGAHQWPAPPTVAGHEHASGEVYAAAGEGQV